MIVNTEYDLLHIIELVIIFLWKSSKRNLTAQAISYLDQKFPKEVAQYLLDFLSKNNHARYKNFKTLFSNSFIIIMIEFLYIIL